MREIVIDIQIVLADYIQREIYTDIVCHFKSMRSWFMAVYF